MHAIKFILLFLFVDHGSRYYSLNIGEISLYILFNCIYKYAHICSALYLRNVFTNTLTPWLKKNERLMKNVTTRTIKNVKCKNPKTNSQNLEGDVCTTLFSYSSPLKFLDTVLCNPFLVFLTTLWYQMTQKFWSSLTSQKTRIFINTTMRTSNTSV